MLPLMFYSTGLLPKITTPVSFPTTFPSLSYFPISNSFMNQIMMISPSPVLQQNYLKEIETFTRNTHSADITDEIKV